MEWEADYEKYILDFARLAQSEKWNCFVLGRNSVMPLQNVLNMVTIDRENQKNIYRKINLCR
jgi:hypothetical protein